MSIHHTRAEKPYRVVNPMTGEVIQKFPSMSDHEVDRLLSSTTSAFTEWKERSIAERAAIVARIASIMGARIDELALTAATEMGKPLSQGREELEFTVDIFNYYAEQGPGLLADQMLPAEGGTATIQRRPIGTLLGIMPWNFPYYQVARFAAPNLVLGNTMLLKHAENCPRSALAIVDIFREAGVPEGVYANVFATHRQIASMIADPRLQGVSLTGSDRAGAAVAELAGRHLKKVVLELGGSDPYVILDTADVPAAAEQAWNFRVLNNTGQTCNSNKRIIVMDDIFESFVDALVSHAEGLRPGDPAQEEPGTFPPLASRAGAEALHEQVQEAVDRGATLRAGGVLQDGPGAYYSPAVLTGVTPDMRAYHEELFGPVLVVYRVSSDEEALRLANDTVYGLGGAVFSQDVDRARAVAERLDCGMSNVNTPAGEAASLPFGGAKRSGFGRELGPLGIDEFANKRLFFVAG
jgi:succinate-semialdehyde dehydrogenase/glutarate-semialdehyde dehydrogenase